MLEITDLRFLPMDYISGRIGSITDRTKKSLSWRQSIFTAHLGIDKFQALWGLQDSVPATDPESCWISHIRGPGLHNVAIFVPP
jgi:hypothetical protein